MQLPGRQPQFYSYVPSLRSRLDQSLFLNSAEPNLAPPPAFRSSEVMGSPLFKRTSWAQRDHPVSWRFGKRGDEDQTGCADSGIDLFLRHSKQSATRLRPKQATLCARINKWTSLSLKYDLGWHNYVSNKMSFAQFGLSHTSSPEEPAGKMLPCTPWWMFSECVLLMHVFLFLFFFSEDWQRSILWHTSPLHAEISPTVCRPSYRA